MNENGTTDTRAIRGVTIGFVIAMLLLLGVGMVIIQSTLSYQAMSRERTHVRLLILEMRDLLADLQNAETGQRGYLLTGDEQYLSPYIAGRDSIPKRLSRIHELANPYRSTTLDIQRVSPLITNKLTELAQTIEVRREQGFSAAQRLVEGGSGKKIMDDIRLLLGDQAKEIEHILQLRIFESEAEGRRALISSSVGGCLSVTLLILSFIGLRREIQGRQQAEEKLLLKEHNERLLRTLEKRNSQLEQTNHTLANREAHLRAIIENEPECVKLLAADGTLLDMNAAGLRLIEADTFTQVQSHCVYPLIVTEHRDAFRELTEAAMAGKSRTLEFEIIGLKGSRRWLETHASPLRDATGKVLAALGITRDITERKHTEATLREREQQLRLFVQHSPAAIAMLDTDMRYLLVSNRWLSDYRLGDLDVIGRSHYEIFPDIPERWKEIHRRCLAGGIENSEADPFPREDGSVDWVRWEIRPWLTAQGGIGGVLIFSEVITERKVAEQKLSRSEEQLRLALDASNIGLWDWNLVTNEVFFSKEWKSQIGYREDEISNRFEEWQQRVHPDDLSGTQAKVQRFIKEPEAQYSVEFRLRHKDQSYRWIFTEARIFRDANQKPVRMLGCHVDITARKQAEDALRESESRLRIVAENAGVGLVVVCPSRHYLYSNAAYSKMFKLSQVDIVGKRVADVLHTVYEDQIRPRLDRAFAGERVSYELLRKTDEGEFHYAVSYEPAWSNGTVANIVVVVVDITERKRAELTLRQSEEYAQRLAATQSAIFDALPAHVALVDARGVILSVNQAWRRFATANSLNDPTFSIGKDYLEACELTKGDDAWNAREIAVGIRRVLAGQSAAYATEYSCHSPEKQRWFRLIVTPLRENQSDGAVIMHVDITERQKAEQRFSAFATLGRRLNAAPDVETAARIIANLADELFGWDACKLDLYDENTDLCQSLLTIDILDGRRQDVAPAYANEPPSPRMRRVMQEGPMLILRENPSAAMNEVRPFGDANRPSASIMFVPVTEGRKVIGVLSIQSYTLNAYTQADLNALQDLTDHCAGALERLRGRDALRASEQRLRSILDTMFVFVGLMNLDGELVEVNNAPLEAAGLKREEVLGQTVAETYWFAHCPAEQNHVRQALNRSAQGEVVREDYSIQIAGGQTIVIDTTFAPLRDASGRVIQIVGSAVDVTERKHAEEILYRTEQLYRQAITGAGAVPYDYDYATRRYTFMGAEIEGLTGYRAEDFCGPLWQKIIQENIVLGDAAGLSVAEATQKVLRGEIPQWRSDIRIRTLAGGIRWLSDVSVQKLDAEGRVVGSMGILQDITERKLAEQKLAESSVQLRALLTRLQQAQEEERVSVARDIHDELGQLLTGLKMDVRWLERKLADTSLPQTLNPLLDRAVAASALADQTIAVVQKIAADLRPGALDRLGLGAALQQKGRRFEERTGVTCHVTVPEKEPPLSAAVATELFYIAQEALTNVTRHAQATEVQIRLEVKDDKVVLEVCDDGRGITEIELNMAQSLGLLGMRERAAHCDGTIVWERCEPQGTRLTVRVPCGQASDRAGGGT